MSGAKSRYSSWSKSSVAGAIPQLREEKMLEAVLRKKTEKSIRSSLFSKMGREPSKEEREDAFKLMLKVLRETGVLENLMTECYQSPRNQPKK